MKLESVTKESRKVDIDMSRGLRNNNPLNIRRNSTKWQGLAEEQKDKDANKVIELIKDNEKRDENE